MRGRRAFALGWLAIAMAFGDALGQEPIDLARWGSLDLEARWVLQAQSQVKEERLIAFLKDQREEILLEWIAITGVYTADPLVQMESPRWIRAACWNVGNPDSHSAEAAQRALLSQAPTVLAWLDKNPVALDEPMRRFLPKLEEAARSARGDAKGFEPALDPAVVLRDLEPPERVVEFGDRPRVQPGRVYLHQVQRAIDAMLTSGRFDDPWRGKLLRLTSHAAPAVRQAAYLAFTRFPAAEIPYEVLRTRSREAASADDRAWALLALSYSDHPGVLFELSDAATEASTPRAEAATSRLRELGNGFTAERLQAALPVPARTAAVLRTLEAIDKRERLVNHHTMLRDLRPLLEQAAWAAANELDCAAALDAWTRRFVWRFADDARLRKWIETVRDSYTAPEHHGSAELRDKLTKLVRDAARAILSER